MRTTKLLVIALSFTAALAVGLSTQVIEMGENQQAFKEGYDPLLNQMRQGSIQNYIATMQARVSNMNAYRNAIAEAHRPVNMETSDGVTMTPSSGVQTAADGLSSIAAGATGALASGVSATTSGVTATAAGVTEAAAGEAQDAPSGVSDQEAAAAEAAPSGAADAAASGEMNLPSALNSNPDGVAMGNYYAQNGIFDLAIGLEEPADYFGAGDLDVSYKAAPFRVVNDNTNADIKALSSSLGDTMSMLSKHTAKPMAATNAEDEKVLAELNNSPVTAEKKVTDKIAQSQLNAAKQGDPFEINVLHRIGTKMRKIQDAIVRTASTSQQTMDPQTAALSQLVNNVKAMRQQAEDKYQRHPMSTFAKDEKRLLKMEKLHGDMQRLAENRNVSPREYNHKAAILRDKLQRMRASF